MRVTETLICRFTSLNESPSEKEGKCGLDEVIPVPIRRPQ